MTEWRVIERFPDYEVSSDGEVRRRTAGQGAVVGHVIKRHKTSSGYPNVRLAGGPGVSSASVHRLVAEAFIGPRPEGQQTRHLDGDKENCAASNLAYGTGVDNGQDKVRHGRSSAGEKNPKAKLKAEGVASIRSAYESGESAKAIAARVGLNPSTVHRIVSGRYWGGVLQEASNRAQDRATR